MKTLGGGFSPVKVFKSAQRRPQQRLWTFKSQLRYLDIMFDSRKWLILALAFGCVSVSGWAHPHVWVTVRAQAVISSGYLEKVLVYWTFDELFSSLVMLDNDANLDGKLDANESLLVRKTYFDNLKGYGYFTHMSLGKRDLAVKAVNEFLAGVSDAGRVMYQFSIPVGQRLDATTAFSFAFYDETFYTDMAFEKSEPVKLLVTEGGKAWVVIQPDSSKAFYGGQVVPIKALVTWKPS